MREEDKNRKGDKRKWFSLRGQLGLVTLSAGAAVIGQTFTHLVKVNMKLRKAAGP